MLALRLQRTGRKGHAQYRLIAQDSHRHPSSGKVSARLGSYDPHTKKAQFDKEKIEFYLEHGAQPSSRLSSILVNEGIKLPSWVSVRPARKMTIKKADKLRKHQPKQDKAEVPVVEASKPEVETTEESVAGGEQPAADSSAVAPTPAETPEASGEVVAAESGTGKSAEKAEKTAEAETAENTAADEPEADKKEAAGA